MSVLSVGLSSAGRTGQLPSNGTSDCRLSQALSVNEDQASLLVELDGQLVRLQDCNSAAGSLTSTGGVLLLLAPGAVGAARRAPEVGHSVRLAVPTKSDLLYYLPDEDGYLTADPATD